MIKGDGVRPKPTPKRIIYGVFGCMCNWPSTDPCARYMTKLQFLAVEEFGPSNGLQGPPPFVTRPGDERHLDSVISYLAYQKSTNVSHMWPAAVEAVAFSLLVAKTTS